MVKKLKSKKQTSNSDNKRKNKKKISDMKATLKNMLTNLKSDTKKEFDNEANYTEYISDIFNSRIINMLIVYFNKRKDKLKQYEYDTEQNFIYKFAYLIKELYLNEIEVAYLTLLMDKLGWNLINYDHWVYFYTLGIYTKDKVTDESISKELRELKEELKIVYGDIINMNEFDNLEEKGISVKEINARYKELSKPINSFCRKDFIIYSGIADKIVRLSQPYGEDSNGNQLIIEKKIIDENNNNYEKEKDFDIFMPIIQKTNPNMNTLSIDKNDIKKIIRNKNASIKAEKSAFTPNFQPDLSLRNIGGSQLSLIGQRSDRSLKFDKFSSSNNFFN